MSEIKKPVITKEQAETLERMRRIGHADKHILMASCDGIIGDDLKDLDIMTLAAALINGYEVEKTPEEKVRELYATNYQRHEQSMPHSKEDIFTSGVAEGIRSTVDCLGIKIEGVNA